MTPLCVHSKMILYCNYVLTKIEVCIFVEKDIAVIVDVLAIVT